MRFDIILPRRSFKLFGAHGDVSSVGGHAVQQRVLVDVYVGERNLSAAVHRLCEVLPFPRQRERSAEQAVILHVADTAVDDVHRLRVYVVILRHTERVLLYLEKQRVGHERVAAVRQPGQQPYQPLRVRKVEGYRIVREDVACVKSREQTAHGRSLVEFFAGISDQRILRHYQPG